MVTSSAFVTQLYNNIDGREPTSAERDTLAARIDTGAATSSQVAAERIDGVSGQHAQDLVRLYVAAFDRYPDLPGLRVQELAVARGFAASQSAETVYRNLATSFVGTAEFAAKYPASTDAATYVRQLYTNVLDRAPEPAGLAAQVAAFQAMTGTIQQKQAEFLYRFASSAEFVDSRGPEVRAAVAYLAVDAATPIIDVVQQVAAVPQATIVDLLNDGVNGNGVAPINTQGVTLHWLTTQADTVAGATGNVQVNGVISAVGGTFGSGDVIQGGPGNDVLSLTVLSPSDLSNGATLSGIETIAFRSYAAVTQDASLLPGVDTYRVDRNLAPVTLTNLAAGTTLALSGDGLTTATGSIAAGYVAGATTATLDVLGSVRSEGTVTFTGAGLTTVVVNSTGAANLIGEIAVPTATGSIVFNTNANLSVSGPVGSGSNAATIVANGSGHLNLVSALADGVHNFNGSAATGDIDVRLGNGGVNYAGGAGVDTVIGGGGADVIAGGGNQDRLTGGGGADAFLFAPGSSGFVDAAAAAYDEITDFTAGVDRIDFGSTALSVVQRAGAVAGHAQINAAGLATFAAADTTLQARLVAVEAAINDGGTAAAGQAAIFASGGDTWVFISDGVDGLATGNDVLVRLVGGTFSTATVTGGDLVLG
jgi:Ca2+-binding RTX toxin-like protein